jgi:uracil-DNA glycosylase family 4
MIVGETPESLTKGRSGRLLSEILWEYGFDDENTFVTHAVSCQPPEGRAPTKKEIVSCSSWLEYQIEKVKPKFVLLMGNAPCQSLLGLKGIKKLRGKPIEKDGIIYLPTYSPAFVVRDDRNRPALDGDIKLLKTLVDGGGIPEEEDLNRIDVLDRKTFRQMLRALKGTVSFDIETSCLYPWRWHGKKKSRYKDPVITAIGFGTRKAQYTIPFHHWDMEPFTKKQLKRMVDTITEKLEDCIVVAHNGKFDALWMKVHYGVDWTIDFDTMLAHYLLDENQRHGLKYLSQVYLGAHDYDIDPTEENWEKTAEYHCKDLLYTRKLKMIFGRKLYKEGDVKDVFDHIVMPASHWFTQAEYNGVCIDTKNMDIAEEYLLGEIAECKAELKQWGKNVNWGSPQQVAKLLFEDLGLDIIETTAGGKASTKESVLKQIDHPLTVALLRLRGANQQYSFFIKGWKPFLVDGRLHPSFKLHGAVTGRPSCEHPNFQQVPRDPRIRSLVTAPTGWVFVEADLSQIEMRLAGEYSNDSTLLAAFYNKEDVHWKTAIREIGRSGAASKLVLATGKKLNGKKLSYGDAIDAIAKAGHVVCIKMDGEWKNHRKKAKAINFGYLYGMWWVKFKEYALDNYGVKVTDAEAKASREAYFELYPGLVPWHKKQKNYAKRHGYVTTLTGRKRRLPAAAGPPNDFETKEAQRQAINSPVQGCASDLNLMAAIQIGREFGLDKVRPVGTIHDAVALEVREDCVEEVVPRILEIMAHPEILDTLDIRIKVPIEAEAAIGAWSKGVSLKEWMEAA